MHVITPRNALPVAGLGVDKLVRDAQHKRVRHTLTAGGQSEVSRIAALKTEAAGWEPHELKVVSCRSWNKLPVMERKPPQDSRHTSRRCG